MQLGSGGLRALGRMVRADEGFTASYRLVVAEDGTVAQLSVSSATAERERHLTLNRTEDGLWLLDRGSGADGIRADFAGAVDVDLEHSPMLNTLPIRRLNLHRAVGEHTLTILFVALPGLEVETVQQTYRTLAVLDDAGSAVVEFRSGEFVAELTVDADAMVESYPGVATRLTARPERRAPTDTAHSDNNARIDVAAARS